MAAPYGDVNYDFAPDAGFDGAVPEYTVDFRNLPKFKPQPPQGDLSAALSSGYRGALGTLAGGAAAFQAGIGNQETSDKWANIARGQLDQAQAAGVPELETAPWNPGGSWANLPRQIPYQIVKQLPNVGMGFAGAALGAGAAPALGLSAAAGGMIGAAAASYPQSVGSVYGEHLDKNKDQGSPEAGREAMLYGVPHAALESLGEIPLVGRALGRAFTGVASGGGIKQVAKDILKGTAETALGEGATEGAQRVIELTQRPDMTIGQKANSVIENAFFGAMAGGGMGAVSSGVGSASGQAMRALRQLPANDVTNDDIKQTVDSAAPSPARQQAQQAQEQQAQQAQQNQQQEPQVEGDVSFAPPEMQEAPPAQPQRQYTPDRPFGPETDENLNRALDLYSQQGNEGMVKMIRLEQMARANEAQQASDLEKQQRVEERQRADAQFKKDFLTKAGLNPSAPGFRTYNFGDDMTAADQVAAKLKEANPSKATKELAAYLGLTDEKGKPHDLGARLEAAHYALDNAKNEQDRVKATRHLETLSRQFDLNQRMSEREKPEAAPRETQVQIHDAAQKYADEQGLSTTARGGFIKGVQAALDNTVEPTSKHPRNGYQFAKSLLNQEQTTKGATNGEVPNENAGVTPGLAPEVGGTVHLQPGSDLGGNASSGANQQGARSGPEAGQEALNVGQSAVGQEQENAVPASQGTWNAPQGQSQSVTVDPQVRTLPSGKKVQKVTTVGDRPRTYYVPADQVSVGGPSAASAGARMDANNALPPAVDSTAPETRPSASGTRPEPVASTTSTAPRSAPEMARAVGETLRKVTGSKDLKIDPTTIKNLVRQGVLYVASLDHIDEVWGKEHGISEVTAARDAMDVGQSVRQRAAATQMPMLEMFHQLPSTLQDALQKVYKMEAEDRIKPLSKTWEDEHEHIINDPKLLKQQKAAFQNKWASKEVFDLRRTVRSSPEAMKVYEAHRHLNNASMNEWNTVLLLKMLREYGLKEGLPDPHADFQTRDDIEDTPESVAKFWKDEKDKVQQLASGYLKQLKESRKDATVAGDVKVKNTGAANNIETLLKSIHSMEQEAKEVPYSHLARFGNEVVSFHFPTVKVTEDGVQHTIADPVAVRAVAREFAALEERLGVHVSPTTTQKYVYMRFENNADMRAAKELAHKLADKGWIEKGSVYGGARDQALQMDRGLTMAEQKMLDGMVQSLKDSAAAYDGSEDETLKAAALQQAELLKRMILDALPDNNMRKVLVSRKRVTGAASDMVRGTAHRFQMNNSAVASMISGPRVLEALNALRERTKQAGYLQDNSAKTLQQLHHELAMRFLQPQTLTFGGTVADTIKALTFTGAMGMSVSTALMQGMSVLTLGFPQLGAQKGVGMVRAARALTQAIEPTARILSTVISEAVRNNPKSIGDVLITPEILRKAGFAKGDPKGQFIMRVINTGIIEMGTLARDLGQIVAAKREGAAANANTLMRWMNAMNQYMEVASRLTMAFASLEVHKESSHGDLYKFTNDNITNSLFDFSNKNAGRLFNRSANPVARLATTFMSYPAMWLQKLIREFDRGFLSQDQSEKGKQFRTEARQFMAMHFGMMLALSGVSGLPFASALFSVLNGLFGSDAEPYDVENQIRSFFAHWLGKGASDVLMRGTPRLVGADISGRIGGADLAPFSQFFADQRGWREAMQGMMNRGFGAPASMALNVADGVDKIFHGEFWDGMRAALPRGIQNMMDASQIAAGGPYRDAKGHELPFEPGFGASVGKFVGFKSNEEADWQELRKANDGYEKQLQQASAPIVRQLVRAVQSGNETDQRRWLQKARDLNEKAPQIDILGQVAKALKGEVKSTAREKATGLPRAVDIKDPRLLNTVGWAIGR